MNRLKLFYTTPEAADEVGLTVRHYCRAAEALGIQPKIFSKTGHGGSETYRWTPEDIERVRDRPPGIFKEKESTITVGDRYGLQVFDGANVRTEHVPVPPRREIDGFETICHHCPHAHQTGYICCQCHQPVKANEFSCASSLQQLR